MSAIQQRLVKDVRLKKPYSYGPYNKVRGERQAIRITEGCVNNCPQCYEPTELKIFGIPEIVRNDVLIFDMNPLCKPEMLDYIKFLGKLRVNGKPIRFDFVCGIDYRFLTQELADAIYLNHFCCNVGFDKGLHKNKIVRIAWDGAYSDQKKIKRAIDILVKAGFKRKEIMIFMQCNHTRATFETNCLKLDLCKVWNVKVCDCYFDGQIGSKILPIYWLGSEIKVFRHKVRKHNQLVNFEIDPEVD